MASVKKMDLQKSVLKSVLQTAELLSSSIAHLLTGSGLTPTQYNALRILRGAVPDSLTCSQISERMMTRDSDITRLLDRLENMKLVVRFRDKHDRRAVRTRINQEGLDLLSLLDKPVDDLEAETMSALSIQQMQQLTRLLSLIKGQ
jgi:DNA-binding MarR family transcriptional regulator